jgi:hypothetical protein
VAKIIAKANLIEVALRLLQNFGEAIHVGLDKRI